LIDTLPIRHCDDLPFDNEKATNYYGLQVKFVDTMNICDIVNCVEQQDALNTYAYIRTQAFIAKAARRTQ